MSLNANMLFVRDYYANFPFYFFYIISKKIKKIKNSPYQITNFFDFSICWVPNFLKDKNTKRSSLPFVLNLADCPSPFRCFTIAFVGPPDLLGRTTLLHPENRIVILMPIDFLDQLNILVSITPIPIWRTEDFLGPCICGSFINYRSFLAWG